VIKLKRVYDPVSSDDGKRLLVERLWPRGLTKEKAQIALWSKEIAPSEVLRKWYGHIPERWTRFRRRYLKELEENRAVVEGLLGAIADKMKVTFVYAARDTGRNSAVVLKEFLEKK